MHYGAHHGVRREGHLVIRFVPKRPSSGRDEDRHKMQVGLIIFIVREFGCKGQQDLSEVSEGVRAALLIALLPSLNRISRSPLQLMLHLFFTTLYVRLELLIRATLLIALLPGLNRISRSPLQLTLRVFFMTLHVRLELLITPLVL